MRNRYVFDLDGTLALVEHRRPLLDQEEPDWHSFHQASLFDAPNEPVVRVLRALHAAGYEIWISSARSDAVMRQTRGWLRKYEIPFHTLLMRSAKDQRADHLLKQEWALQYEFKDRVHAVFDDRASVVAMWRELGIPCFQVAEGAF